MPNIKLANRDEDLQAVLVERKRLQKERNPDIDLRDFIVLKNGPQAYKVASHWAIVDRHTGEMHHHSFNIETYRRTKDGYYFDELHSITLVDGTTSEVKPLITFLASVLGVNMPDEPGDYLIIPIERDAEDFHITEHNLNAVLNLSQRASINTFSRLIDWALETEDGLQVIEKLNSLKVDNLQKLNTLVGISNLRAVLEIWEKNKENNSEEFWQKMLMENSFVFSQIFSFPVIILNGKAYVGGKGIENTGGNIIDFLCANDLTKNAALVEIKTPETRILGPQYRGDVYNISPELSGSIIQVSNYKDSLTKEYYELVRRSCTKFEAFNPQCLVIAGNLTKEVSNATQQKSFELFRNGLNTVQVISYDELFKKVEILVDLLEGKNANLGGKA